VSMRSELPSVRLAAVAAAGLLELPAARQPLLEMLEDPDQLPDSVRRSAIWSLSQIGGEDVGAALEYLLENTEDVDEVEFLEDALENLEFTEGFTNLDMMDYDPELAQAIIEEAEPWPEPRITGNEESDEDETEAGDDEDNEEDIEDDL
jgi:HEAT repeat protein